MGARESARRCIFLQRNSPWQCPCRDHAACAILLRESMPGRECGPTRASIEYSCVLLLYLVHHPHATRRISSNNRRLANACLFKCSQICSLQPSRMTACRGGSHTFQCIRRVCRLLPAFVRTRIQSNPAFRASNNACGKLFTDIFSYSRRTCVYTVETRTPISAAVCGNV